jgi:hypothetical protein
MLIVFVFVVVVHEKCHFYFVVIVADVLFSLILDLKLTFDQKCSSYNPITNIMFKSSFESLVIFFSVSIQSWLC